MEIRPARPEDLTDLAEIDGTIESAHYLHLARTGEGLTTGWRLELWPLREQLIEPNRTHPDQLFLLRQIVSGMDEGVALVAEHDEVPVALLLAQPQPEFGAMRLIDVRVDFDQRRAGLATAMLFQLIADARERGLRAVTAETRTNNLPAASFLSKSGFELAGVDTARYTNHDLVKEAATLLWYAALD